jgi:ornithine decarboxylase
MFVNSGVYQQFGAHIFDLEFFKAQPLLPVEEIKKRIEQHTNTFIWGQTCDGCDWFTKNKLFPLMNMGEWLLYRNMGAYNSAIGTPFNGFAEPKRFYI